MGDCMFFPEGCEHAWGEPFAIEDRIERYCEHCGACRETPLSDLEEIPPVEVPCS